MVVVVTLSLVVLGVAVALEGELSPQTLDSELVSCLLLSIFTSELSPTVVVVLCPAFLTALLITSAVATIPVTRAAPLITLRVMLAAP